MFEKGKLHRAVQNGDIEAVAKVIKTKRHLLNEDLGDYKPRPLSTALRLGNREMIDFLHSSGAHVTQHGRHGRNMLFDAVYHARFDVLKDWAAGYSGAMQETSWSGETLLHTAASRGHAEIVAWLLEEQGFDSEKPDENGRTALYYAEKYQRESVMAILKPLQKKSLQKYEAKATRLMDNGQTVGNWRVLGSARVAQVQDDSAIGYRITEIFNFATMERTRLYRNIDSDAETVETTAFAGLPDAAHRDIFAALDVLRASGIDAPSKAVLDELMKPAAPRLIEKKGP